MIGTLARHPILTFTGGVLVGYIFAKQLASAPLVNRVPQKG